MQGGGGFQPHHLGPPPKRVDPRSVTGPGIAPMPMGPPQLQPQQQQQPMQQQQLMQQQQPMQQQPQQVFVAVTGPAPPQPPSSGYNQNQPRSMGPAFQPGSLYSSQQGDPRTTMAPAPGSMQPQQNPMGMQMAPGSGQGMRFSFEAVPPPTRQGPPNMSLYSSFDALQGRPAPNSFPDRPLYASSDPTSGWGMAPQGNGSVQYPINSQMVGQGGGSVQVPIMGGSIQAPIPMTTRNDGAPWDMNGSRRPMQMQGARAHEAAPLSSGSSDPMMMMRAYGNDSAPGPPGVVMANQGGGGGGGGGGGVGASSGMGMTPQPDIESVPRIRPGVLNATPRSEEAAPNPMSKAEQIAERLLRTEEELDRLRRQGQQIGERLRAQSRGSPPKIEGRSPPSMGGLSLTGSSGGSASKGALKEPGSSSTNRSVGFSDTKSVAFSNDAAPARHSPSPSKVPIVQPVVPVGSKEGGAESGAAKSPPKAGGASTVSETRVSNDEAAKLGLPPGTLWFDPTNKGQMDMIAAQVGGGQKAEAAPPASKLPRSSGQSIRVPPVASLPREEVDGHFQALGVAWSGANLDAIKRAYKILAFSRVEDEGELAAITLSYKICEGALSGGGSAGPTQVDPLELYHKIVHTGKKHPELKVELGVSIEDLINGHIMTFDFERMVCAGGGERDEEKCQLKIDVKPGMRAGTQFVFQCEGDEAEGMVPSDVRVTLVVEPHSRFVAVGDNLATEVHVSVTDALCGGPITVLSATNSRLSVQLPRGSVLAEGFVFRCPGEGLPMSEKPVHRGDLFIKVHVHFPSGLMLSKEQENVLRTILGKATVQVPSSPHDKAQSIAHISYKSGVLSKEEDFWFGDGSTEGDEQPLLCAQQ